MKSTKKLCCTNPNAAIETFRYSIVYLMALFAALLVDHYLPIGVPVLQSGIDIELVNAVSASAR